MPPTRAREGDLTRDGRSGAHAPPDVEAGFYRALVASTSDAVLGLDRDGRIVTWNRAAEAIFGFRREEVIGRHVAMLAPAERAEEFAALYAAVSAGETITDLDTVRRRRDGTLVHLSLTISPVMDDRGTVTGASTIARDVSTRRAAEERIADLALELLRANTRLREFASLVAHELREPAATAAELIRAAATAEVDRSTLARAARSVVEIEHVLADLSDYASVGRAEAEAIALDELLDDVSAELAPRLDEVGATIEPGPLPLVRLGRGDARLLLRNLIANAIRFRSARPLRIRVDATRRGSRWELTVADNGIGIAPRDRAAVFEPFVRLRPDGTAGTGLGLAIVKVIVEGCGGDAWIEGVAGGGARAHVTLPAASSEEAGG
ncbi:MAG: two-component system sensor histidine kinase NtrB [Pseudomonadota bacterium]